MPDRDYYTQTAPKGWQSACRFFATEGATGATVTKVARALAAELRSARAQPDRVSDVFDLASKLLSRCLMGPARTRYLACADRTFADLQREDTRLRQALVPHLLRFEASLADGKPPRAPRSILPSLEDRLAASVPVSVS